MLVKINPEKLAPAAIRNEKTLIKRAMSNPGAGESAIILRGSLLVTSSANASNPPRTALPNGLLPDGKKVFSGLFA
jgi:hypothetical protein